MIELNKKTQQDFLNREWVQKLLDAGVDMSDAKYWIVYEYFQDKILPVSSQITVEEMERRGWQKPVPTYTVSELLYKLHEWIYPTIDGVEYSGGLRVSKCALFYLAYYDLREQGKEDHITEKFFAESEYPIESLASLLIQCHTKDIGLKMKNTDNIRDK